MKEKKSKEKGNREKPDEVDNFFKKILKKEGDQHQEKQASKNVEKTSIDTMKREELNDEEKQRILAAVEIDQQVIALQF